MRLLSYKTAVAYKELAGNLSKREKLSLIQQDQIKTSWVNNASKQTGKESGDSELQAYINIQLDIFTRNRCDIIECSYYTATAINFDFFVTRLPV